MYIGYYDNTCISISVWSKILDLKYVKNCEQFENSIIMYFFYRYSSLKF